MMVMVDPRRLIAVHPADISAMRITRELASQGECLVIHLANGHELKVWEYFDNKSRLDLRAVHERLMEACK
jgi:hypothetical protein